MTFDPNDAALLSAISPVSVASYLTQMHWHDAGPWGAFGRRFVKTTENREHEVTVVTSDAIADFQEQMAELVTRVAAIEGKTIQRLLAELSVVPFDVVRVRAKRSDAFGSVLLSEGEELFESARDIVVSAAVHTATDRVDSNRRGPLPVVARDYLDKVRLGQTERGSFVLTILSPFTFNAGGSTPDMFAEPFGRRVVQQLGLALVGVEDALKTSVSAGVEAFRQAPGKGVGAKLVKALGQLAETGGGTEISVAWSPQRPRPERFVLNIQQSSAPMLHEAASLLMAESPPEPVIIDGPVVGVSEQNPSELSSEVRIYARVDGSPRVIKTSFTGFERQTIFEAFEAKKSMAISVTGELIRSGRPWTLINARDFRVIDVGE